MCVPLLVSHCMCQLSCPLPCVSCTPFCVSCPLCHVSTVMPPFLCVMSPLSPVCYVPFLCESVSSRNWKSTESRASARLLRLLVPATKKISGTNPQILFSGSFHLLQHPGYRVCCLESHTKCSVSAGTWYQRLYFLLVLGNHLLVKTSICRSSRGSAESEMVCFITFNLAECAGQPNAGAHRRCDAGAVFWGSSCLQDWGLLPRWHRPTVRCC